MPRWLLTAALAAAATAAIFSYSVFFVDGGLMQAWRGVAYAALIVGNVVAAFGVGSKSHRAAALIIALSWLLVLMAQYGFGSAAPVAAFAVIDFVAWVMLQVFTKSKSRTVQIVRLLYSLLVINHVLFFWTSIYGTVVEGLFVASIVILTWDLYGSLVLAFFRFFNGEQVILPDPADNDTPAAARTRR